LNGLGDLTAPDGQDQMDMVSGRAAIATGRAASSAFSRRNHY
jgi:hypothetical protein